MREWNCHFLGLSSTVLEMLIVSFVPKAVTAQGWVCPGYQFSPFSLPHILYCSLSVGQFWISRKMHGIEHIRPVAHIIPFGHAAYIIAFFLWATRRQATNCVEGNCHRYHDNTVAHCATSQTSSVASDRSLNYLCFNFSLVKLNYRNRKTPTSTGELYIASSLIL